jgi:hypothetical protein
MSDHPCICYTVFLKSAAFRLCLLRRL